MYKLSYYNIVTKNDGTTLYIWNTKRGSIVNLEKPLWDMLLNSDFNNVKVKNLIPILIKEGILVQSDLNEQEEIMFSAKQRQLAVGHESFGLVIAPTMSCNYNCSYCFERGARASGEMSVQTQDDIIKALSEKLSKANKIKKGRLTWFGGEPLLAYDNVISHLQQRIVDLCRSLNIDLGVSIITNGYFLTEEKFDYLFRHNNTRFVQVTFDGTEKDYVMRKGTTPEAYRRAIDNVLNLSDYVFNEKLNVNINIRLNVDNKNFDGIKTFVDMLRSDVRFHDNIYFALERLREYGSCQTLNNYCTTDEFEKIKYEFDEYIGKPQKILEPKLTFCGQHCMNVFCIGVHGELYKCEHDFGIPEHSVGDIKSGLAFNKYFVDFMYQPLPEKCNNCKILPICMGGCPHRRLENNQNVECEHTLENLIKSVNRFILQGGEAT